MKNILSPFSFVVIFKRLNPIFFVIVFLFLLITGLLLSCSKEEQGTSLSGKIYRIVKNPGSTNSDTTEFVYDENGRIKSYVRQIKVFKTSQTIIFERNSSGQITSLTELLPSYYYSKITVVYTFDSNNKYKSAQLTLIHNGNSSQQNDEYIYTGNRITQIDRYQSSSLIAKTKLSYDGSGNVNKISKYNVLDSLILQYDYTYDNKRSSVESIDDPYSLEDVYFSSNNNVLGEKFLDVEYPPVYLWHSYTYNSQAKPLTNIIFSSYDSTTIDQSITYNYIYH